MTEESLVITEYFTHVARNSSNQLCLQIKKGSLWERWTYAQLEEKVLKIAGFLVSSGFKKGDFACLILENRPEWSAAYLGILTAGLSCVPLDPQLGPDEIKNLILDSEAKIIFTSSALYTERIKSVLEEVPVEIFVLERDMVKIEDISYAGLSFPSVFPSDIASVIYTSGTTSKPKGVALTHKNICANFLSIKKMNLCLPSDNFLSILPLHHTYAFMVTLIVPLFLGAKITYALSLKEKELTQLIKEASVTVLVGVPQLFSLLHKGIFEKTKKIPSILRPLFFPFIRIGLKPKLGSLRFLVSGGARLEPEIAYELNRVGLKVIEGYGLTEASPVVTFNPPQKIKFGSVGKPLPDVEIKIFNPDEKGIGEVLIKGLNVMAGYFKQPELTAEAIKDGWLYSGDLGYIDKDGYLYLVGRKKEVIVLSSGKNIYPQDLEEYYSRSPYIKEICILHKQDKTFGYLKDFLFAVIVPDLEYFQQKGELSIHEKIRWELENLGRKLASYQHIMGFVLTKESLPRTSLGKIKRHEVKEKYLRESFSPEKKEMPLSEQDRALLNKDTAKILLQYLSKEVNKPVNLDSHLEIDLGIDSLTRVELGLGLEAVFKIEIPDEVLYKVSTVRDLVINLERLVVEDAKLEIKEAKEKSWGEILRELPPKEIIEKIKIFFGFYESATTWLVKNILLFLFRLFWFLRVEGVKNLPTQGPYLICPNHASYLDGFFIFLSLPFRVSLNTYFLGHQKILEQQ